MRKLLEVHAISANPTLSNRVVELAIDFPDVINNGFYRQRRNGVFYSSPLIDATNEHIADTRFPNLYGRILSIDVPPSMKFIVGVKAL